MLLKSTEEIESPSINLTSMIDVLFLLIIFFMVGTRFNESEHQINLNLPRVNGAAPMIGAPRSRIVTISKNGSVALDGRVVSNQQLSDELSRSVSQYRDTAVDVRCDGELSVQKFTEVADAIRGAGVTKLGIIAADSRMPMRR